MITIDVTCRSPIYEQIVHGICGEIARGVYKENERIPAARELAKQLGLNPNTVAKAYGILERDGIIYSVAGKGCFAAKQDGRADRRLTAAFEEQTKKLLSAGVGVEALIKIIRSVEAKLKGGDAE